MILIVDDNEIVREMQVAILESANYSVRDAADGNELPIVLVSALPEDEEREVAISRGATDYISKPFDIPSVLDCVKHYISCPAAT